MSAYGTTIFCDDLRMEASGKFMLIGCYGDTIILNEGFPSTLPALHFHVNLFVPRSEYVGDMKIEIYFPSDTDAPSLQMELPRGPEPSAEQVNNRAEPGEELQYHLALNLTARPVLFSGEGFIKVRAVVGGKRIRLGELRVAAAPREGAPAVAAG